MRSGKVATCVKINLADQRNVEIAAMSGFDCVWVDMEHIPSDWSFIENAVRSAKCYDVDVLTRVSKGCYSDLVRPLEGDSTGIMVPHLMSLEEAKKIVYYTKFHPVGRRPIDGGNADGKYCLVDEKEYVNSLEIAKIREQYPDCSLDCLPVYREPICAAEQEKYPFTLCSGPRTRSYFLR